MASITRGKWVIPKAAITTPIIEAPAHYNNPLVRVLLDRVDGVVDLISSPTKVRSYRPIITSIRIYRSFKIDGRAQLNIEIGAHLSVSNLSYSRALDSLEGRIKPLLQGAMPLSIRGAQSIRVAVGSGRSNPFVGMNYYILRFESAPALRESIVPKDLEGLYYSEFKDGANQ